MVHLLQEHFRGIWENVPHRLRGGLGSWPGSGRRGSVGLLAAGFEVGFGLFEGLAELTGAVFGTVADGGDFLLGGF